MCSLSCTREGLQWWAMGGGLWVVSTGGQTEGAGGWLGHPAQGNTLGSAPIPVGESELSPVPQFPHLKIKDK